MKITRITILSSIALISIILAFTTTPRISFASGPPSVVQTAFCQTNSPGASINCSFGSNVASGDIVVVLFSAINGVALGGITPGTTNGNYHAITDFGFTVTSCASFCGQYWAAYIDTLSNAAMTVSFSDADSQFFGLALYEVSGITSVLIQNETQFSSSTGANTCCTLSPTPISNYVGGFTAVITGGNQGLSAPVFTSSYTGSIGSTLANFMQEYSATDCNSPNNLPITTTANPNNPWGMIAVSFNFSASSGCSTTVTNTITGFVVPNFVNGVNSFSWLYFMIIVFVPMGEIIGTITAERSGVLDRHSIIFVFLALLLLDSIFGVMINLVTIAMPFIFGILFGIYLWRGRG